MRIYLKVTLMLLMLIIVGAASSTAALAQGSSTISEIVSIDARFTRLNSIVQQANLHPMFQGNGPYTLLAPSDDALNELGGVNPNILRQVVLYHTLQGNYSAASIAAETDVRTAFGKDITVAWDGQSLLLNGDTRVTVTDIQASNGTIHVIDAVLVQDILPSTILSLRSAGGESAGLAANTGNNGPVTDPSQNPSFVSGGNITYWAGVHSDSSSCKGTTWTLHYQMDGVASVGSDRRTNPYRGDQSCSTPLPVLCLQRDFSYPPNSTSGHDYLDGWAFGNLGITIPISGSDLISRETADAICAEAFGAGARMAEFHDGNLGAKVGSQSGHDFWALGNVPSGTRFWVAVNDQPANPWNSVNPKGAPPNLRSENIFLAGADPAFIGIGPARMSIEEGVAAGRNGCQGNTWVIHKQINGKVQVGGDHSSNPFVGDRPCSYRFPVLCIRVDGWNPPANSHGEDYSIGWSGGYVKASNAVTGVQINTREKANAVCQSTFGSAWRMAEFHDGSLGTANTDGWEFWAYGSIQPGLRFWVANNDQPSNPWNE